MNDTVTIPRHVAETLCEALEIMDNPYTGTDAEDVAVWADFITARDEFEARTYPNGSMADYLRMAGHDIPQEAPQP